MFANGSCVKYKFNYQHKKLARITTSSVCHQQFASMLANFCCVVYTNEVEFANTRTFNNFSLLCGGRFYMRFRNGALSIVNVIVESNFCAYTVHVISSLAFSANYN